MNARSPYHDKARLQALQPALKLRGLILSSIRDWFNEAGFTEIETPVRLPAPALELHIDAEPSGDSFLRTSPELHMKRLLAAGYDRIYQIGPCFRKGERGTLHNPEYTMLEWYRANADYRDIMEDAENLLTHVSSFPYLSSVVAAVSAASSLAPGEKIPPTRRLLQVLPPPPWPRLTVEELFLKHAGWNPVEEFDAHRFEEDLVSKVEPVLPRDTPVFMVDYPAPAAALALRKPEREAVAERFELYINGVEIANAFSELTDPVEQRRRFETCARDRQAMNSPVYPLDEEFLAALDLGMPPSGGIALGIDRLVMVLTGAASLDAVMAFREQG